MATILVIDDEDIVRELIARMLRYAGHEVQGAADGIHGMTLYRQEPADLVITDIQMPGKSGLEVIRELRAEFPDAKIIAVTGQNPRRLEDALELGANHTFTKPFAMEEFLRIVESLVGGTPRHRGDRLL